MGDRLLAPSHEVCTVWRRVWITVGEVLDLSSSVDRNPLPSLTVPGRREGANRPKGDLIGERFLFNIREAFGTSGTAHGMKRGTQFLIGLGALVLCGAAIGWAVSPLEPSTAKREAVKASATPASGILDGMVFRSELGPKDKPADVNDQLIFANGMFQSIESARRCGYPPSPYYVRQVGETIQFVSESHCQDDSATMFWEGTIENGVIKGRIRWTAKRWYRTIENEFWFEGAQDDGTGLATSSG